VLELALTRLFSVVLFYHFASRDFDCTAGVGRRRVSLTLKSALRASTRPLAARLCIFNSVLVLLVLEIVLHVPSHSRYRQEFSAPYGSLSLRGITFLPDWITILVVFARETWRVSRLYGADLSGGALACLAVVHCSTGSAANRYSAAAS